MSLTPNKFTSKQKLKRIASQPTKKTKKYYPQKVIEIFIKIRPLSLKEKTQCSTEGIRVIDSGSLFIRVNPKKLHEELLELKPSQIFNFKRIFDQRFTTTSTIQYILKEQLPQETKNQAFFCFGPKRSGKTSFLIGDYKEFGLFPSYLRDLFLSINPNDKKIYMKAYEFGSQYFRDLLLGDISLDIIKGPKGEEEITSRMNSLKMGFNDEILGVSKYEIKDFSQGLRLLKIALKNNMSRDRLFEKSTSYGENKESHLCLELEVHTEEINKIMGFSQGNEENQNNNRDYELIRKNIRKMLFVDFGCGEPIQSSLENFEKIMLELSKKGQNQNKKLVQFYKEFDDFSRFLYKVFSSRGFESVFIGCLCGSFNNNLENRKTLEFLKQIKKIHSQSIEYTVEEFLLKKEFEKSILELKTEFSGDLLKCHSFFFKKFEEIIQEMEEFVKIRKEFQKNAEEVIEIELEGYLEFEVKNLDVDFLFKKQKKFGKECIKKELEGYKIKIGRLIQEIHIIFLKIKNNKRNLKIFLKNKNVGFIFLSKISNLFVYLEKHIMSLILQPNEILMIFKNIMKQVKFPSMKIIHNFPLKYELKDEKNKIYKFPIKPENSNSKDVIQLNKYVERTSKRDWSLEDAMIKAKARIEKEKSEIKIVRLRNHKIILEKLGKGNYEDSKISDLPYIKKPQLKGKKRSFSSGNLINNSFSFKVFVD